jgi:hypothetical protein
MLPTTQGDEAHPRDGQFRRIHHEFGWTRYLPDLSCRGRPHAPVKLPVLSLPLVERGSQPSRNDAERLACGSGQIIAPKGNRVPSIVSKLHPGLGPCPDWWNSPALGESACE